MWAMARHVAALLMFVAAAAAVRDGVCPDTLFNGKVCQGDCKLDEECPGVQKCCLKDCGLFCVDPKAEDKCSSMSCRYGCRDSQCLLGPNAKCDVQSDFCAVGLICADGACSPCIKYPTCKGDVCTTPDVYRTFLKSKHDCIVPDKVTDLRACQWHNKACVFVDKTTTPAAATTLPTTTTTPGTTTTLTENKSCPPIRCPTPDNGCYWNREKATIVLNCPVDCGPLVCPATTTPATTTTTLATTTPQVSCVTDSNCPQDKFCLLRRGACVPYVYGDHQAVAPAGDIKWAECTSCRAACLKDDAKNYLCRKDGKITLESYGCCCCGNPGAAAVPLPTGVCFPRQAPGVCPDYIKSVCGCDGKTYSNECYANYVAHVNVVAEGACAGERSTTTTAAATATTATCPQIKCHAPEEGCTYDTDNAKRDENGCAVDCGPQVCRTTTIATTTVTCPQIKCHAPEEGCTYDTDHAKRDENGCAVDCGPQVCRTTSTAGTTTTSTTCPQIKCAAPDFGCTYDPDHAKRDENGCLIDCGPQVCPERTTSTAKATTTVTTTKAECPAAPACPPVRKPCQYGKPQRDENGCITACGAVMCDVPPQCIVWFDGCNVCQVRDGQLGACTKTDCSDANLGEAGCRKYDYCLGVECGQGEFCVQDPKQCASEPCEQHVCIGAAPVTTTVSTTTSAAITTTTTRACLASGDCGTGQYCALERGCLPRQYAQHDNYGLPSNLDYIQCKAGCDEGKCAQSPAQTGVCLNGDSTSITNEACCCCRSGSVFSPLPRGQCAVIDADSQPCRPENKFVCGCDGNTYRNPCLARKAGVNVAAAGACPNAPTPASTTTTEAPTCPPLPVCQRQREGCSYDSPVRDDNDCVIGCGELTCTPVIPKQCVSWFDGCNTCSVVDGEIGSCTKRDCETRGEAECRAYDYCQGANCDDRETCVEDPKVCSTQPCAQYKCVPAFTPRTTTPGTATCPPPPECPAPPPGCDYVDPTRNDHGCLLDCGNLKCACNKLSCDLSCPFGLSVDISGCDECKCVQPPPHCQTWFDGCNDCMLDTTGAKLGCTKRVCDERSAPKCKASFAVATTTTTPETGKTTTTKTPCATGGCEPREGCTVTAGEDERGCTTCVYSCDGSPTTTTKGTGEHTTTSTTEGTGDNTPSTTPKGTGDETTTPEGTGDETTTPESTGAKTTTPEGTGEETTPEESETTTTTSTTTPRRTVDMFFNVDYDTLDKAAFANSVIASIKQRLPDVTVLHVNVLPASVKAEVTLSDTTEANELTKAADDLKVAYGGQTLVAASTNPTAMQTSSSSSSLNAGATAGVVIGVVVGVCLLALVGLVAARHMKQGSILPHGKGGFGYDNPYYDNVGGKTGATRDAFVIENPTYTPRVSQYSMAAPTYAMANAPPTEELYTNMSMA